MEIGPVSGIRPVVMVKPVTEAPDLAGVFAVAFRQQDGNDSYLTGQKASRGLEEDETDDEVSAPEPESLKASSPAPPATISFFA